MKTLSMLETASEKTAKALVRRHDIQVVSRGMEAHYNWKTKVLTVPAYSIRDDATEQHVFAWRGILDHECAHVAYSDGETYDRCLAGWTDRYPGQQQRIMTIANVFEDFYIERKWVETNPGSVKHLKACADIVIAETGGAGPCHPDFVPDGGDQPVGVFMALIQSMLRVNSGHVQMHEIDPQVALVMALLHDEIEVGLQASSSEEVCQAAEAVWAKLSDLAECPEPEPGEGEGSDEGEQREGDDDGDNRENGEAGDDETDGAGDEAGDDGKNGDDDGDGDGDGDDTAGEDNGEGDNDDDGDDGGGGSDADDGDDGGDKRGGKSQDKGKDGDNRGKDGSRSDERNEGGTYGYVGEEGHKSVIEAAEACCGGEYAELATAGEIVAGLHIGLDEDRPYTVNPITAQSDSWERYDQTQRQEVREQARGLRQAAGPAITTMANLLRCAVKAQKQTLWVGGLEEGEDLDPDSLPGLAIQSGDSRIFQDQFNQIDDNAFVMVLVDCSGSMGDSVPRKCCPVHGKVNQKGDNCSRKDYGGKRCGEPLTYKVDTKSGYAAMTATVLHDALRLCGTPHAVLGYSNRYASRRGEQEMVTYKKKDGTLVKREKWSRQSTALWMHEFVAAPGISDNGSALPYINGYNANLDGESVIEAAKYAVKHASSDIDRIVMLVVADGAPAGADDWYVEDRHLTDSVERIAQAGIEVYGIGIGIDKRTFSKFYPEKPASGRRAATGNVLIQSGKGLSNAVMKQLTDLLVRQNGRGRR